MSQYNWDFEIVWNNARGHYDYVEAMMDVAEPIRLGINMSFQDISGRYSERL